MALPEPITRLEQYWKAILDKIEGGGGPSVTVEPLTVAQNGTTTAPSGKAYSPVTVAVPIQASKSVTIDEAGTVTITPDSGYEAMEEVVVTAKVPSVSTASLVTTFTDGGTISGSTGRNVNTALNHFRTGTGAITGVLSDGNKASLISETYTGTTNYTLVFATHGVTTTVSVTDGAVAITGERGVTSVAMYKTTISYPS